MKNLKAVAARQVYQDPEFSIIIKSSNSEISFEFSRQINPSELVRVISILFNMVPQDLREDVGAFALECSKFYDVNQMSA